MLIISVMISKDIDIAPSGSALLSSAPRAQPAISLPVSKTIRSHGFDCYLLASRPLLGQPIKPMQAQKPNTTIVIATTIFQ